MSCDSDTGHSEPPTDYSTAVSCCLPCPCIQSCTNKHVCCPEFGLHNDSDSYFEASRAISTSHNVDQYSVTQSIEHTTTGVELQDLYRNRSVLNQQHGTQSKFDLDSRTEAIQSFTDATNLNEKNSRTTVHLLPHTDCIRPQVFNNPNFFIDSNAYSELAQPRASAVDGKLYGRNDVFLLLVRTNIFS